MKRNSNLFPERLNAIEQATWYRQRFDACPHFMFFLGDAHTSSVQHTAYPFGQRIAYAGFSKNRADWYHSLEELEHTASQVIDASKRNSNIAKEMIAAFLPWQESFYRVCSELRDRDLSTLDDTELLKTYDAFAKLYTNKLNCSPLIDGFALSTDTMIAGKIKTVLESKGLVDTFVSSFATLTAPIFLSFLQQEEIALLRLAASVNKDPQLESTLLAQHQRDWFWIRNNYVKDFIVPLEDFKTRLDAYRMLDIVSRIAEIESFAVDHRVAKETLITEIGLQAEIQTLLEITDDFNAWQDERKKGTFFATHYFSLLLEEFAKRTLCSVDQLKYAFPPEMGEVLSGTLSSAELDRRTEYCMIVWTLDSYDVTTDRVLIDKLDRIGTGEVVQVHELKGFTASRGNVTGRVKIIESAEEMHHIEVGDVMIAVMTRPDYLPAMEKAAAFVTDEGGITCHAAIIAREMKKPCIIGTKIATKVFQDGDLVEVNADTGMVKLIEKKK